MAIETREIGYRVDGRTFRGYLADGSNGKKTAAVLVARSLNVLFQVRFGPLRLCSAVSQRDSTISRRTVMNNAG